MTRSRLIAASLAVCLCGCGSSADGAADAAIDCSTITGVDVFTVGLDKPGVSGNADFKLMSIAPAPIVRGDNTWVIQLASTTGAPIDGAMLSATPFMPAHQHGSPITPVVTATGTPGEYSLSPINLWMPGVWETTLTLQSPSADRATFTFCVN